MRKFHTYSRYNFDTPWRSFSGPCKNNGSKPIRNDPSGPGIRLANIFLFLPMNVSTMVKINIAKSKIIQIKYHIMMT